MLGAWVLAWLLLAVPAFAEQPAGHPAECRLAERPSDYNFPLPQVARAIAAKQLNILVLGAGSSSLPGPNGIKNGYPARLQSALQAKLAGRRGKGFYGCEIAAYRLRYGEDARSCVGGGKTGAHDLANRHRRRHVSDRP